MRLRRRVTYANVVVTLALVFAMSGGAYAAKRFLITSTKQISPKVLKALQGKAGATGPAGPAGPTGPVGPQGVSGANGKDGVNGGNGVSVVGSVEPTGEHCALGGSKFVSVNATTYACNGETGFTETLPEGKTEMGMWALENPPVNPTLTVSFPITTISFVIPLALKPTAHKLAVGAQSTSECPGTVTEPKAAEGQLCIYLEGESGDTAEHLSLSSSTFGSSIIGNIGEAQPGGYAYGSWAVTG